jgi:hypothetical protein
MRTWLLAAVLACSALRAGAIRGTVVEQESGHPLVRASVKAQPLGGTPGSAQIVRTDGNGAFEFPPLATGAYLVTASRPSFAPAQYGQRSWRGSGAPVVVEKSEDTVLTIRMRHYGSVGGTVRDENDVGLPEHDVVAYRNTRPPKMVAKARTDDRGVFRIGGLEPGSYLVRTAGKQDDESSYLPTFSHESQRIDEAQVAEVMLDRQTEVTVRPVPGRLLRLGGRVVPQAQVTLNLVSDIGTVSTVSDPNGGFLFNAMPPGSYELFAISAADRRMGQSAVYREISLDRDQTEQRVALTSLSVLRVEVEDAGGKAVNPDALRIWARRRDLSGEDRSQLLRFVTGRAVLPPGRWELRMEPAATYYVSGFVGGTGESAGASKPDGWNQVTLTGNTVDVKFVLAANPGGIKGKVSATGQLTIADVPVYLEPYDAERRRSLGSVISTRTGAGGQFAFIGLGPGTYRLLSTLDYQTVDSSTLESTVW